MSLLLLKHANSLVRRLAKLIVAVSSHVLSVDRSHNEWKDLRLGLVNVDRLALGVHAAKATRNVTLKHRLIRHEVLRVRNEGQLLLRVQVLNPIDDHVILPVLKWRRRVGVGHLLV